MLTDACSLNDLENVSNLWNHIDTKHDQDGMFTAWRAFAQTKKYPELAKAVRMFFVLTPRFALELTVGSSQLRLTRLDSIVFCEYGFRTEHRPRCKTRSRRSLHLRRRLFRNLVFRTLHPRSDTGGWPDALLTAGTQPA